MAKVGDQVVVYKDGQKILAEVNAVGELVTINGKVKDWISEVKILKENGKVEFLDVTGLAVDAILILEDISASQVFKAAWKWITQLFRNRKKRRNGNSESK